jgi:hypothetical protein
VVGVAGARSSCAWCVLALVVQEDPVVAVAGA